jgi:PKD repeat protein
VTRASLATVLILLLIGLSPIWFSMSVPFVHSLDGTQSICWVNLFDNTESTGWTFTGASPYLHNDTGSYVTCLTASNCSWFHFQDTDLVDLQNVFLMVELRTRDVLAGGEVELYLDNGVFETGLGSFDLTLEYRWVEINVTSALGTPAYVNSAKLKIKSLYSSLFHVVVRRAYLRIYNGPVLLQTGTLEYGRPGGDVTLSAKWADPDGLNSFALNHNASGSWLAQNLTGALLGTEAWSNHTVTLQLNTGSVLAYRFWASDANGNWERTGVFYVYPVKNFSPELLQSIGETGGSPISHSYGRKDFYDSSSGRFWIFYSDGTNMKYTSTTDGQAWFTPQTIRPATNGFTFYVHVSMGAVHYVYNSEGTGEDVYYRKGTLNSDGTIAWVAPEQVAVDAGTSKKFYVCSIVSDNAGYPYIVFGNRTDSASKTLNLVRSNRNDGVWNTSLGFPKQVNTNPDADLVSGVALDLPENKIYIVYCSAGGEEPPRGRLVYNSTLGPLENISAFNMLSNYVFSAVSDKYGNVHVVYRRTSERIDYSCRDFMGGNWVVKDELVSSHVTDEVLGSAVFSWPVISCGPARANPDLEEIYVHWWTLEDKSAWLIVKNNTGWEPRQRIIRLDNDKTLIDGDVIISRSISDRVFLLNFVTQDVVDEIKELWAYLYINKSPTAHFTESAETVYTGEAIIFNASESDDPDGTIVSYVWNFGDGANATGVVVEHDYYDDGNYTVTLTVTDDDKALDTASAEKIVLNRAPHASFTTSPSQIYPTLPVVFNASDSYDSDGTISSYFWDFGDEENATGVFVEHAYVVEGNFTVTLEVTDDDGATDTAAANVTVLRRDVALSALVLSKTVVGAGFTMSITVTVENQGMFPEEVSVTATANLQFIQTKNVLLAVGNSTVITFTWNTTAWAKGEYIIQVEVSAVPGETDLADNTVSCGPVSVTLPGDVDGDRDVDIFDLVRMTGVYGVEKPDIRYSANCDIDDDGDIDIFDLVITAGYYGKSW